MFVIFEVEKQTYEGTNSESCLNEYIFGFETKTIKVCSTLSIELRNKTKVGRVLAKGKNNG